MLHRVFTLGGLSLTGVGAVLGAVVLLGTPKAWSQQDTTTTTESRVQDEAKDKADRGDRESQGRERPEGAARFGMGGEFHDPLHAYHTYSLNKEREEVEILEAQLAAKRAHIRLAEARLKQAQDQLAFFRQKGGSDPETQEKVAMLQAEVPVLEAERDAERAEIREPQVLLQHARQWMEHLERIGQQGGFSGPGGMFGHMGMGMGMGGRGRMGEVNEEIEQLRRQVENLQRQLDNTKGATNRQ